MTVPLILIALCSVMAGGLLGTVLGFSFASHPDVMRGVRPRTRNRFLLLICRPTASLSLPELAFFLAMLAVWLVIFFALCSVPALAAKGMGNGSRPSLYTGYALFIVAWWLAHFVGARIWRSLT